MFFIPNTCNEIMNKLLLCAMMHFSFQLVLRECSAAVSATQLINVCVLIETKITNLIPTVSHPVNCPRFLNCFSSGSTCLTRIQKFICRLESRTSLSNCRKSHFKLRGTRKVKGQPYVELASCQIEVSRKKWQLLSEKTKNF